MNGRFGAMVVALAWCAAACSASPAQGNGTGGGGNPACPTGTYVSDFGGLPATARVNVEILTNVTYVSGDIRSATAYYTFTGETVNGSGFVDVVHHNTNQRFRAQVDATADGGFVFTANAYEGQYSTPYQFSCKR
jgi:hypothetical protein